MGQLVLNYCTIPLVGSINSVRRDAASRTRPAKAANRGFGWSLRGSAPGRPEGRFGARVLSSSLWPCEGAGLVLARLLGLGTHFTAATA